MLFIKKLTVTELDIMVKNLSLKDDILFNMVFKDDLDLSKQFLEILEGQSIEYNLRLDLEFEEYYKFSKRTIFDMRLLHEKGCFIVEVQNDSRMFPPQRSDLILSNAHSNLCPQGTKFENYPYIVLHVVCAFDNFKNNRARQIVKQSVLGSNFEYKSRICVIYHNITSNSLPSNIYGDLCRFMYDNTLSNHEFIIKLNNKIKNIKESESTKMKLHENLSSFYWIEQVALQEGIEKGIEEGTLDSLVKLVSTLYNQNKSKDEVLKLTTSVFDLPLDIIEEKINNIYN